MWPFRRNRTLDEYLAKDPWTTEEPGGPRWRLDGIFWKERWLSAQQKTREWLRR